MWLSFVASAIAAVSLQYIDPFGTSKLVLFQVTNGGGEGAWLAFELVRILDTWPCRFGLTEYI